MRKRTKHVALLIETSRGYGRGLLRGIKRYISEQAQWSVFVDRRALDSPLPGWLKDWKGDGILCRSATPEIAATIRRRRIPSVELRLMDAACGLPLVRCDDRVVGRIAAEHFLKQGYRHFGCLLTDVAHDRHLGFAEALREAGFVSHVHRTDDRDEQPRDWERQQAALGSWISGLPKPVGVFAVSDALGFWLLDSCVRTGTSVPEDLAAVGVEDDELLCSLTSPPLSSVRLNTELIGYRAAELLDRMMDGKAPPKKPLCIEPLGVTTRDSSNRAAVNDRPLAPIFSLIRERACSGLTIEEVVRTAGISRSTLERRMRAANGRSPKAEIRRVRIERVRQLLLETDLPLESIAIRAGFNYVQYMVRAFKEAYRTTPGSYRRQSRFGTTDDEIIHPL